MNIKHAIKTTACAAVMLTTLIGNANAGSQQAAKIQHEPKDIVAFSKGVEKYAAARGARAFIIARVGRPVEDLPKGIFYTHTAIAIYSAITLDNGRVVMAMLFTTYIKTQKIKPKASCSSITL
jgi:hypothetical protein